MSEIVDVLCLRYKTKLEFRHMIQFIYLSIE